MAEVYANLIRRGRKTIEQVPEHLRDVGSVRCV